MMIIIPPLMFTFEKDLECTLWEEIQGPRIDAAPNVYGN